MHNDLTPYRDSLAFSLRKQRSENAQQLGLSGTKNHRYASKIFSDGNVLDNDTDADNDSLVVTKFTVAGVPGEFVAGTTAVIPGVGTLLINKDGSYDFAPNPDYTGPVPSTTYTISDGKATSSAVLSFSDVPSNSVIPNSPPLANDDGPTITQANTHSNGNVLDNDTDADNDPLVVTKFTVAGVPGEFVAGTTAVIPGVGTLLINKDGSYDFAPNPDYTGPVPSTTYTISDGKATSSAVLSFSDFLADGPNNGSLILLSNPKVPFNPELVDKRIPFIQPINPNVILPSEDLNKFTALNLLSELRKSDGLVGCELYLTGSLKNQVVLAKQSFSFSIPFGTFRHSNGSENLEYDATKPDGTPLPNWLRFYPNKLTFSGVPPLGAKNTDILVTAKDNCANRVFAQFRVIVNKDHKIVSKGHVKSLTLLEAPQKMNPTILQEKPIVGKPSFTDQISSSGKLNRLIETRQLLNSLKQLEKL